MTKYHYLHKWLRIFALTLHEPASCDNEIITCYKNFNSWMQSLNCCVLVALTHVTDVFGWRFRFQMYFEIQLLENRAAIFMHSNEHTLCCSLQQFVVSTYLYSYSWLRTTTVYYRPPSILRISLHSTSLWPLRHWATIPQSVQVMLLPSFHRAP